jgi:predicted lipoprotein with Yx(FWY)xxD motif
MKKTTNKKYLPNLGRFKLLHSFAFLMIAFGVIFISYIYQEQQRIGLGMPPVMQKYVITKMYNIVEERNAMMLRSSSMLLLGENEDLGSFLTDKRGLTLYTSTNDEPGISNCYGYCTNNWKVLWAEGNISFGEGVNGELGIIERTDGPWQVTYNDQPLYFYEGDKEPGDTNGNGIDGTWSVAKP